MIDPRGIPAWLLSRLLHSANSAPPFESGAFYRIKDRILARWGERLGTENQRIVWECWGPYREGCLGEDCPHCGGTGVYDQRFCRLERWQLGAFIFHSNPTPILPTADYQIFGRIKHERVGDPAEAYLWLALLFDLPLFCRSLIGWRRSGWRGHGPLGLLQAIVFEVYHRVRRLRMRQNWRRALAADLGDDDIPF